MPVTPTPSASASTSSVAPASTSATPEDWFAKVARLNTALQAQQAAAAASAPRPDAYRSYATHDYDDHSLAGMDRATEDYENCHW